MPNYSVSVSSGDNMALAKAASETGLTVEKYCAKIIREHCMKIREHGTLDGPE
jgi:hypothetical protein